MDTFYITTPIYYPNAPPHIGHAYTTVFADVVARYMRLSGYNVFFLTGNDEHGLKIQKTAEKLGKDVKALVDEMAEVFKNYWRLLDIDYSHFIRTTDKSHEETVKEAFKYIYKKGLIYRASYRGLYCVECEKYYSQGEYIEVDGKPYCPLHNKPLEEMEEDTYYFKLSEFKDYVYNVLKNTDIVYPRIYAEEVLSKLSNEGLRDISIARPVERVWWGIPVPFDPNYVIYVWFDALLNYISAIDYLRDTERFNKYWRNVHHVIGKDILWFHTVVWFSILKALDIDPPKKLIVHSYLTVRGAKMSKSIGNVVSIDEALSRYGSSDAVRYLLMRIFNFDKDSELDLGMLDNLYNSELADTYGNLVRRAGVLALKKTDGKIYRRSIDQNLARQLESLIDEYERLLSEFELSRALGVSMEVARLGNQYLNETKPWEKSDPSKELYAVLEIIRISTIMLYPFTPRSSAIVADSLGFTIEPLRKARVEYVERYNVSRAPILFKKITLSKGESR